MFMFGFYHIFLTYLPQSCDVLIHCQPCKALLTVITVEVCIVCSVQCVFIIIIIIVIIIIIIITNNNKSCLKTTMNSSKRIDI